MKPVGDVAKLSLEQTMLPKKQSGGLEKAWDVDSGIAVKPGVQGSGVFRQRLMTGAGAGVRSMPKQSPPFRLRNLHPQSSLTKTRFPRAASGRGTAFPGSCPPTPDQCLVRPVVARIPLWKPDVLGRPISARSEGDQFLASQRCRKHCARHGRRACTVGSTSTVTITFCITRST